MKALLDWLSRYIFPTLMKIGEQTHIRGIRNGIVLTVPFTIAGSIFLIFSCLPFNGWEAFIAPYSEALLVPVSVTFGILSLIAVIGIAYNLAREFDLNHTTAIGLSLVAYLLLNLTPEHTIDVSRFDATGLFSAMIITLLSVEVLRMFVKRNIVIKLPENVPPAVYNSFIALLPAIFIVTVCWIVRVVLNFDISITINAIFQPLVFALNTLPGIMIFGLFVTLLWCVGIHGDNVLMAIGMPIFTQYLTANATAFAAHQPIPYITASGFLDLFVNIGGTGATLALVVHMLFSRDKGYRMLGRVALPNGIFEINEPVTFGFPIVMNPIMMIPYVVIPQILIVSTFMLMKFGIIGVPVAQVPWTMPPIIGPFLAAGGDWRNALWSICEFGIALAVYFPFFKAAEALRLQESSTQATANATVSGNKAI